MDVYCLRDDVEEAVGRRHNLHLGGDLIHEEHEFVATQSSGEVVGANAGPETIGNGNEQSVTAGVSEEVVHYLKAVEVDNHDRRRTSLINSLHQLSNEGTAIWQSGEVVVGRVVHCLVFGIDTGLELDEH